MKRERIRFEREMYDLGLNGRPFESFYYPSFESVLNFEFGNQDIAKYRDLLKSRAKGNRNPNDLTNLIFVELHPDLKGKKLKVTDKESLKNEWTDIYYQIVLPFLGIKDKRQAKFEYPDELKGRIARISEQFDKSYELIFAIRVKNPVASEFDGNPEVIKERTKTNKTLHELLIPLLIEGLNLNKPDDIYKALFTLDNGRLIDTFVDIVAHNPVLLPVEKQKRYESNKLLVIKTIKNTIQAHLEKRRPSDVQTGVEPKSSKGENIRAKAKPDNPKHDVTGRFEIINRKDPQNKALGMVLCLNQAGNWIEGVLSSVGNPQKFTDDPKFFYRFYAEIKDWSKPSPMIYIRSNLDAFRINARLSVLNGNSIQILDDKGVTSFRKVSSDPVLTERHLAYFKDNPLARQSQWFPLLSAQELNIKSYFKNFTGYPPILRYAKFNNAKGIRNRTLNIRDLLERAVKGDKGSFESLAGGLDQFIEENIHKSDKDLAAFYIRRYLNQTSFEKTGWRLTLASWLYRQLRIYKEFRYRNFQNFIYGNTSGDKITPAGNQLYQYKISVDVKGLGIGYFVKGGYYQGGITITCKQWEELGAKTPDGSKEAKLKIQFGELGGGLVESLNFGQSFEGVAESDVLWKPRDFVGLMSILKADAEVGANITKIRQKLGISSGIGATIGLMEIIGDSSLPPLMFGVYSLSGVVGGVEPKSHEYEIEREGRVGVEVTGSVVIGSIWKDGPLPAPKDVIKYGSEETVLKATYKGDGKAHFKHDSALLTPGAVNLIRKLCANEMSLLMSPKTTVTITGHTDMSGTDEYNKRLSKNRAANVKQKIEDVCGTKIKAVIGEPLYKGEELAKKDPAKKQYDPRYRGVDIVLNGSLVLTLSAG